MFQPGRLDSHYPKVCGHQGNVLDIKWNPFFENIIASCSEDASVSARRCFLMFDSCLAEAKRPEEKTLHMAKESLRVNTGHKLEVGFFCQQLVVLVGQWLENGK